MKRTILLFVCILTFSIISCATPRTGCAVKIRRAGSDFIGKIKNISGDQILFTIEFEDTNCTSSEIDKFSENIFKEYAMENGYTDYKILERLPDKIAAYRYIVVFNPIKR